MPSMNHRGALPEDPEIAAIVRALGLVPLPQEGGLYAETYRSARILPAGSAGPEQTGPRACATAIYYLVTPTRFSALHRVASTEIFHFYLGDAVSMRRAIREHTEHLERLVERKTRELLAAERLAAVGQTVAGLSHSIKNMASGLEGSLFLLRQGLDGDHAAYLEQGYEMLETNVRRLKDLSLDMLRFAKPEDIHRVPANPAEPAVQVAALLDARARAEGIALVLDAPREPGGRKWRLPLDVEALHRCLLNLVGNALDACRAAGFGPDKAGGRVELRAAPGARGGVVYTVSDNGCGMPEAVRQKLFTPFYSTKGEGGSGLGLLTTRQTVAAHGGSIDVSTVEQHGSVFNIIIPGEYENKVS